jgi:hypothetical protein
VEILHEERLLRRERMLWSFHLQFALESRVRSAYSLVKGFR